MLKLITQGGINSLRLLSPPKHFEKSQLTLHPFYFPLLAQTSLAHLGKQKGQNFRHVFLSVLNTRSFIAQRV